MGVDSRVINATVEIETIEAIQELAGKEKRSFSSMVSILLEEAVEYRKLKEDKLLIILQKGKKSLGHSS